MVGCERPWLLKTVDIIEEEAAAAGLDGDDARFCGKETICHAAHQARCSLDLPWFAADFARQGKKLLIFYAGIHAGFVATRRI
ncbi:hypothetical protein ACLOJK_018384 [Asimina triloba]